MEVLCFNGQIKETGVLDLYLLLTVNFYLNLYVEMDNKDTNLTLITLVCGNE